MPIEATNCPSCGTTISARFCPNCGEKRLSEGDLSIGHYVHELLHGLTHADGKLLRSLRAVLLRPGELSLAYMEGRRMRYMRPVSLFLLLNLVYFLLPLFETFNTSLGSQLHFQPYSVWATNLVKTVLERTGASENDFTVTYLAHSSSNAKLLLILMVFLLAPVFELVYFRRTRHGSGQVAFAFEAMCFNLLLPTILLSVLIYVAVFLLQLVGVHLDEMLSDDFFGVIALVLNLYLFYSAGHRFYHCSVADSAWRAIAAFTGLFLVLNVYRLLLFVFTTEQVWYMLDHGGAHP